MDHTQGDNNVAYGTDRGNIEEELVRCCSLDVFKQLCNKELVTLSEQMQLISRIAPRLTDLEYYESLSQYAARVRAALGQEVREQYDAIPPSSSVADTAPAIPKAEPLLGFVRTPLGRQIGKEYWNDMIVSLMNQKLLRPEERGGWLYFFNVDDRAARMPEAKLHFQGSLQELMLWVCALYGTLNYRLDEPCCGMEAKLYTGLPLVGAPTGSGVRNGRTNAPYCAVVAQAVLYGRQEHSITARTASSARYMLSSPLKALQANRAAPLLKAYTILSRAAHA